MKITVDTNVLVRAVVRDDQAQARGGQLLKEAEIIAVSLLSLCESVWVLRRVYDFGARRRLRARSKLCSTPATLRSTGRRSSLD